jgi:anti-sigma-K factor RskA
MSERPMTHDEATDLAPGYVLGALEPSEEAAVRAHLATCPEPHAELEELGGVLPLLLEDTELVEPPAALRERIMDAAKADLAKRGAAALPAPTIDAAASSEFVSPEASTGPSAPLAFPSAADRQARRMPRASRLEWTLRIAAVIAIIAVGAWGLGLQRQLDDARQFDQAVARVLDAAAQPGAKAVVLRPAEGRQAKGIAAVASDGTMTLAMRDLPPTSDGQVYTTWVIVGKNAPVAVGDFNATDGIASATTRPAATPAGAILAVTLEPNPGNTAPKGPVVAAGTAPGVPGAAG